MNTKEWIAQAKEDADVLRSLIAHWHPASPKPAYSHGMKITAPNAESAVESMRQGIKDEHRGTTELPVEIFDKSLAEESFPKIYTVLNDAWIGVPESTDCWGIKGFKEAVALLEDPPEDAPDEED